MSLFSRLKKTVRPVSDLTDADRQDLVSVMNQHGYQVILNIMQQVCEAAETAHFQLDPLHHSADQIAASQTIARSQRQYFERVQKRINFEANEVLGIPQPTGDPDLDDPSTVQRLLDAVRF